MQMRLDLYINGCYKLNHDRWCDYERQSQSEEHCGAWKYNQRTEEIALEGYGIQDEDSRILKEFSRTFTMSNDDDFWGLYIYPKETPRYDRHWLNGQRMDIELHFDSYLYLKLFDRYYHRL